MKIGKLTSKELEKLIFSTLHKNRKEVLVRPNVGEDCAVIDFENELCVLSTDPITGTAKDIGKLAVHISCNDIASAGVEPIGIMLTIMAPESITEEEIKNIMIDASNEAAKLNVDIIGGHTEITDAVNRVIVSSTAIGKKQKKDCIDNLPKASDIIIITKGAGIEGTAVICSEKERELKKIFGDDLIDDGRDFINQISVVKEGVIAGSIGTTFMHDVTEGGILGAIWEICNLHKVGCNIYEDNIYIPKSTKKVCEFYNIDPLRLISSGSMLIGIRKEKLNDLKSSFEKNNVDYFIIGEITNGPISVIKDNKACMISPPTSDELYKVSFN